MFTFALRLLVARSSLPQGGGAVDGAGAQPALDEEFAATAPAEDLAWWNETIWVIGKNSITLLDIAIACLIVIIAYQFSRFLQEVTERGMRRANITSEGTIGTLRRGIHYTVVVVGFMTAVSHIGINLQTLLTAGAIFAVAFGFAMQNIAQNFVSGMILLVERSIKPGDVLLLEGKVVRVVDMGIRATVVRTLDDDEMIVPNASLVQNTVTNYTLRDSLYRLRAVVGVAYGSDMQLVRETLEECSRSLEWRVKDHAPRVHLLEFGDSSVVWEISGWIQHPWHGPRMRSRLHEALWWAFKEKGIVIAYPQLDLHLDPRLETLLGRATEERG